MTNEEQPEIVRTTKEEIEAMPAVSAAQLELHGVYVIQSPRHLATMNYMGKKNALHPVTLDAVVVHHFQGPRIRLDVFLMAVDGHFTDADGTKLTVRRWTGEDQ